MPKKACFGWVLLLVAAGLTALAPGPSLAQALVTAPPTGFEAEGADIRGWTWLRSAGDYAQWYWRPMRTQARKPCVDFALLVTNGPDGGSGYGGKIRVDMLGNDGDAHHASLVLVNPFRPVVAVDTGGVGYQAYGAICSTSLSSLLAHGFWMRMEWTSGVRVNIGVRQQGAVLALGVTE